MNPAIATLLFACGIAGLLYLDREKATGCSKALWIPGLWIAVVGSRSVSQWFNLDPGDNVQLEGSPLDAAFFAVLLAMAVVVLLRRRAQARTLLLANRAILVYLLYCLISVAWSYYPGVSFKRWIKAIGDLAIVLVIATDPHPLTAIRRTVSRVGFILLPASVLLIKYYGELGRGYTADGAPMNLGVTTNKNTLGLTVLVVSLVVLWNVRSLFVQKDAPNRARRLIAQGVLLSFGLVLFWMADSATCKACFALGGFVMIVSGTNTIRRHPTRVHTLFFTILIVAGLTVLFGGSVGVIQALGRESHITGRTEIWSALYNSVRNPIVGAGFESFWISPNVVAFRKLLLEWGWYPALVEVLNEAHNGYIESYLNLGWIGVGMIATILVNGYVSAVRAFRRDPEVGSLILAFLWIALIYNITEAGFRMLNLAWIFLLLVLVSATGVTTGLFAAQAPNVAKPSHLSATRRGAAQRNAQPPRRRVLGPPGLERSKRLDSAP